MHPTLLRACRTGAALELPILVAIAPALLFPTPARLVVLVIVPALWLCIRAAGGRVVPSTPLNAALWLLLAMVGVSMWATFDLAFSLGKVSGVVLGVLLFWAMVRWITSIERLRVAVAAFLLAGAGLAVIGLLGTNWQVKIPLFGDVTGRLPKVLRGIPGAVDGFSPNAVAGCLVLFIPLQVAVLGSDLELWARPKRPRASAVPRVCQSALLVLTVGTLLLTQSRGAFIGMVAALGAFLCWHSRRTRLVAAMAAVASTALALRLGPERLVDLVISESYPGYPGMASHISGRAELWSRSLLTIQDFPFAGIGMNGFRKAMPVLYPAFLSPPDVDVVHAHNHLLQAALDVGIPGLIAYAAIWLVVAVLLVLVYRRSPEPAWRAVASGLGCGLIAHFVFSMTDVIPLGSKVVVFWLALALIVGLHQVVLARSGGAPAA
jgi:putative inorganic carbon (HCO3(-)) transporter